MSDLKALIKLQKMIDIVNAVEPILEEQKTKIHTLEKANELMRAALEKMVCDPVEFGTDIKRFSKGPPDPWKCMTIAREAMAAVDSGVE